MTKWRSGMLAHRTTRRVFAAGGSAVLAGGMARQTPRVNVLGTPSRAHVAALTGLIIWPQDPSYDEARQSFNARFSRFPAAVVVCDNTDDVRNAVRWARQERVSLRARSGGHSYEAFSVVDGGLVVDLGGLTGVEVDASRGEAVIGAGVRLLDCYRRLWEHGVTIPAGTCPSVGIGGLTLGGARWWRRELRDRHRLHLPRAPDRGRRHLLRDLAVGRRRGGARRLAALG